MGTSPSHPGMEPRDTVWAEVWIWNGPVVAREPGGALKRFLWEMHFFQLIHVPGASPFLAMVTGKLAEPLHTNVPWSGRDGASRRALSPAVPGAVQTQLVPSRLNPSWTSCLLSVVWQCRGTCASPGKALGEHLRDGQRPPRLPGSVPPCSPTVACESATSPSLCAPRQPRFVLGGAAAFLPEDLQHTTLFSFSFFFSLSWTLYLGSFFPLIFSTIK